MARIKRRKGTRRTMGERRVTLTFEISVKGNRNVTDSAWKELEAAAQSFAEQVADSTAFGPEVNMSAQYDRRVETRSDLSWGE